MKYPGNILPFLHLNFLKHQLLLCASFLPVRSINRKVTHKFILESNCFYIHTHSTLIYFCQPHISNRVLCEILVTAFERRKELEIQNSEDRHSFRRGTVRMPDVTRKRCSSLPRCIPDSLSTWIY